MLRIGYETWNPIEGYPRYEVSDFGRVRSLDYPVHYRRENGAEWSRIERGRVLKPRRLPNGYLRVCLGADYEDYIHRLVLLAFVGPCPEGMQCAHDDGDRGNNRLSNLASAFEAGQRSAV